MALHFVWKCQNGRFLYWFHNHGGKSYDDRNPAWLVGGAYFLTETQKSLGRVHRLDPTLVEALFTPPRALRVGEAQFRAW